MSSDTSSQLLAAYFKTKPDTESAITTLLPPPKTLISKFLAWASFMAAVTSSIDSAETKYSATESMASVFKPSSGNCACNFMCDLCSLKIDDNRLLTSPERLQSHPLRHNKDLAPLLHLECHTALKTIAEWPYNLLA